MPQNHVKRIKQNSESNLHMGRISGPLAWEPRLPNLDPEIVVSISAKWTPPMIPKNFLW